MSRNQQPTGETDAPTEEPAETAEELRARVDLLETENERLREEYARARRSQYRRTALALLAVGLLALGAAALFPTLRTVLLALGAVGVFGGLLTYFLTPERFVAASVGERVYGTLAANGAAAAADLGLADERVYVPVEAGVRLFVPQHRDYRVPDDESLGETFVVTDDERGRGLALDPTGAGLFAEFEEALGGDPADEPPRAAEQVGDALVEQFELADGVRTDAEDGRVTLGVSGSVYGAVDRFDHPVASLLAVALARGLGSPVTVEVAEGDDRSDYLVTARFEA